MSSGAVVAFVALLIGVLLVVVALMVWQEARRRPSYEPLEYVIEDAVRHISERLREGSELKRSDVRRILEYEVFYMQGLAQENRRTPVETVAGGHAASIDWIADEVQRRHGTAYPHADISEVLHLEADYLMAIGAVGAPVETYGEEE